MPEEVAYIVSNAGSGVLMVDSSYMDLAEVSVAHPNSGTLIAKIVIVGSSHSLTEYEEFIARGSDNCQQGT